MGQARQWRGNMAGIGTRIRVGDIGGTNSRFALVSRGETVPRSARRYNNTRFASFRDAIETYIADACSATAIRSSSAS